MRLSIAWTDFKCFSSDMSDRRDRSLSAVLNHLYSCFLFYLLYITIFCLYILSTWDNSSVSSSVQVTCIREGYRSVPLKNNYSEEIELASLLVHVKINKDVSTAHLDLGHHWIKFILADWELLMKSLSTYLDDKSQLLRSINLWERTNAKRILYRTGPWTSGWYAESGDLVN